MKFIDFTTRSFIQLPLDFAVELHGEKILLLQLVECLHLGFVFRIEGVVVLNYLRKYTCREGEADDPHQHYKDAKYPLSGICG